MIITMSFLHKCLYHLSVRVLFQAYITTTSPKMQTNLINMTPLLYNFEIKSPNLNNKSLHKIRRYPNLISLSQFMMKIYIIIKKKLTIKSRVLTITKTFLNSTIIRNLSLTINIPLVNSNNNTNNYLNIIFKTNPI